MARLETTGDRVMPRIQNFMLVFHLTLRKEAHPQEVAAGGDLCC